MRRGRASVKLCDAPLMSAAGATVYDGLDVLVAQGAQSFELWTGVPAPVAVMRRALGLDA